MAAVRSQEEADRKTTALEQQAVLRRIAELEDEADESAKTIVQVRTLTAVDVLVLLRMVIHRKRTMPTLNMQTTTLCLFHRIARKKMN